MLSMQPAALAIRLCLAVTAWGCSGEDLLRKRQAERVVQLAPLPASHCATSCSYPRAVRRCVFCFWVAEAQGFRPVLSQDLVAKAATLVEDVLVGAESLLHSRHLPLVELLVSGDHALLPHHEFALLPEERPPPSCSVLIEDALRGDSQTLPR